MYCSSALSTTNGASPIVVSHKRIPTQYPVLREIAERWSPRSFDSRPVERTKLCSLFEAARMAPSAHNCQPSRFILAARDRPDSYEKLFDSLHEHNKVWAHRAPVLILASATRERFSQQRAEMVPYPHCMHDLGLAVMSLILQAQGLGLHSHPLAAFEPDQVRAAFEIPDLFEPMLIIAVGYLGSPEVLPPSLRTRETARRTRRSLEEMVFEDKWGQASNISSEV